ncbi:MAG: type VI secretion system contractile sheath large subunit [Gemmataceae bacterium]|nr:type VI secretion system contractile sheath large subunit [Gemmataceae bacterium]
MSSDASAARVRLNHAPDIEFPFVVGVIADLSAHRASHLPPLADREFIEINKSNFDKRLAQAGPHLSIRVPDLLTGEDEKLDVDLTFLSLRDFEPAAVVQQLPMLKRLTNDRTVIANSERDLKEIDRRLSRQLAAVLHHPEFRRLERTWRGLEYLVSLVPADASVKIKALNVNRKTLTQDLAEADGFDQSTLFLKVYDDALESPECELFGMLVCDEEFSHAAQDLELLRGLAGVAEFSLAPLVAGTGPAMFGCEKFADLPAARNLATKFEGPEYAGWRSFRDSEESRFAGLTLPRVLGRSHYDPITHPVGDFEFDEGVDGTGEAHQLWMSGAWAVAGRAVQSFAKSGWFRGMTGPVEGLQALAVVDGGRTRRQYAETVIADSAAVELSKLGFLPLVEQTGGVGVAGLASCQKPKQFHDSRITAHAATGAKLDYLMSLARFPLLLKAMARATLGGHSSAGELERALGKALGQYVVTDGADTPARPLREASVQVIKPQGAPYHQAKLRLRPHFQIEDPDFFMNLQTEIPLRT